MGVGRLVDVPASPRQPLVLVDEEIVVAGRSVELRRPRSAEELIDEREYERDERLPYWAELWPSGRVLAERVAAMPLAGRRVLELGCGLALPSLLALGLGAEVLATDWYPEALDLARANADALGTPLETMLVDWRHPPEVLLDRPRADLVLGADVLYEARNGVALAELLPRIVDPAGEVLIADPRRPDAAYLLETLAARGWTERREEIRHEGRADESGQIVRLHTLQPPRSGRRAA